MNNQSNGNQSKAKNIALWVPQVLTAAAFLMAGFAKLSGQPMMVETFDKIGIGQWFRYVTGGIEVASAILLLIPRLAPVGAAILVCTMIDAVSTHLFVIGGSPVPALVLGCLAAVNEVNMVSYWLGHADINTTHVYRGDRHGDEATHAGKGAIAGGEPCRPVAETRHPGVARQPDQAPEIMCSKSTMPRRAGRQPLETGPASHNSELHITDLMWSSTSDLIDRLCPFPHEPFPQLGQVPDRLFLRARHKHDPYPLDSISAEQTLAIDPQQFAQGVRITPVGLRGRSPSGWTTSTKWQPSSCCSHFTSQS